MLYGCKINVDYLYNNNILKMRIKLSYDYIIMEIKKNHLFHCNRGGGKEHIIYMCVYIYVYCTCDSSGLFNQLLREGLVAA